MSKSKRVLVISDTHCGARTGLTPPAWQYSADSEGQRAKWRAIQGGCWDWYVNTLKSIGPVDAIFANGDLIDGRAERSGGSELLTTDREEQCAIAAFCIRQAQTMVRGKNKTSVVMTYGTPYHGGILEDWERFVADEVGAEKIGGHEYPEVNGLVFDMKHKVGSSTIPHGRHTAVARERLWGQLWGERGDAPKGQVIIRSHVHYYDFCGGPGWLALTTPALQSFGSKYGARQCSGLVDFGMLTFDVDADGSYSFTPHLAQISEMQPKKLVLF